LTARQKALAADQLLALMNSMCVLNRFPAAVPRRPAMAETGRPGCLAGRQPQRQVVLAAPVLAGDPGEDERPDLRCHKAANIGYYHQLLQQMADAKMNQIKHSFNF